MITREVVAAKLLAYLNAEIALTELVDWAEKCFIDGGFDEDDTDMLVDIVMYLAAADRPAFPLTWEVCSDFLTRLGSPVKVVPASSL